MNHHETLGSATGGNATGGNESLGRKSRSSRAVREEIVGKTISGVIARPGRNGEPPMVMMMQFDDGSVFEFVSPRSDRVLERAISGSRRAGRSTSAGPDQLALAVM